MTRRLVVTGTPGTGKTSATDQLDHPVCHLNEVIREEGLTSGTDDERDSLVADLDALERYVDEWVAEQSVDDAADETTDDGDTDPDAGETDAADETTDDGEAHDPDAGETDADDWVVVESHLAHHLPADRVVLLRCHPDVLADRLDARGESADSVRENCESEAMDVIAGETLDGHDREAIYEIDTTEQAAGETAAAIRAVLAGDREPAVGTVDFFEYLTG